MEQNNAPACEVQRVEAIFRAAVDDCAGVAEQLHNVSVAAIASDVYRTHAAGVGYVTQRTAVNDFRGKENKIGVDNLQTGVPPQKLRCNTEASQKCSIMQRRSSL